MGSSRPTIRERLAVVETQISGLKEDVQRLDNKFGDFKKFIYSRLDEIQETLIETNNHLSRFNPGLTGKDKAAIATALITGLSSIIMAIVKAMFG